MVDNIHRTDNLTPEQRKRTMARVKSMNTTPEMIIRRIVHRMGYRYRLHSHQLPGNHDMVFVKRRKIIFVHGCFWHGHECKSGIKQPKTNSEYWLRKLQRNKSRDTETYEKLKELDWEILVVWECELKNREHLIENLHRYLGTKT